jgi:protein SCO1/2
MRRFLVLLIVIASFYSVAQALERPGEVVPDLKPTTQLGAKIDLNLTFTAEDGTTGPLSKFAKDGRPFILAPAYYHCPSLCGLLQGTIKRLIGEMGLVLNQDYRILMVSFDTEDTAERARARAESLWEGISDRSSAEAGWRFLVTQGDSAPTLMNQIGFKYLPDKGEFAHAAALMILTPDGQISQYFTDVNAAARDVKLALVEASRGSIGSAIDHVMLFCFRFDQTKGKYTWAAFNIMRAGGALTLLFLAGLVLFLRRREKVQQI